MWRHDIGNPDKKNDDRFTEMMAWLAQFSEYSTANPVPASADASFRRYFRIPGSPSRIVMDAPPPQEDCRPFVKIAGFLETMGLNSPRVLEADIERGFLLLSDLGSTLYLDKLTAEPQKADALYADAIAALQILQREGMSHISALPPYDEELLRFELSLFHDWLCRKHLHIEFSDNDAAEWQRCCDLLVENALGQETVFVHRDYHSRNLMLASENNPGIIDFQDAVAGPLAYDLVSLLKDCYVKWPAEKIEQWALSFLSASTAAQKSALTRDCFLRQFDLLGVQRHLKAAGIFARLLQRDGKPGYMKDVPRTLSYIIDIAPRYGELEFLAALIARRVLPALGAARP
jgi:aminoglycoside/choline kinase family phosphotransferase